ncbi:NADH-quinone oxidoreductase subunit K [bacterium BMS3Abin05]|nr:NADH-quinone oxidoreductase subunit K [bacterium BMS3Abin05]GBE27208.1 NADH-quinone oxidoreductase subunit K [bacterium BMS3Bbin03]HDZ12021.1 NADH-quinone oxidoreductase subunit NuoK [Bacteroidota bacterium]
MIQLPSFLIISAIVFTLGIFTILYKKNAVGILMGVELILNSVNLNFIAFAKYVDVGINGQLVAIFIIILAASEAAIALAIILSLYRERATIDVTLVDEMKD